MNSNSLVGSAGKKGNITKYIIRVALVLFLLINIYPLIFVLLTSLKSTSDFLGNIWSIPKVFVWQNYAEAWVNGHIGEYFINSIIVTSVSLAIILVIGSLAGYALAKMSVPGTGIIIIIMLVLITIPAESLVIPLYIMMVKMKIINTIYIPLIITYIGWTLPFSIVVLKNFFESFSTTLLEAARLDGSGELNTFTKIVVPLMMPAIGTVVVFNFCSIWGELMWARIATASVDKGLTLTCGLLAFKGEYDTNWGPMSAAICIILIPLIIMFLTLQNYFVEGLTTGAVKG